MVLCPACHTKHWPDCTLQREVPILPYGLKMAFSNKMGILRVRAVQTVACLSVDYPWEMTFSYGDSEHSVCNTQLEMNKKYTRRAVCQQAEGGSLGDWGLLSFLYFPHSSTMNRYYFYNHKTVLLKRSFPSYVSGCRVQRWAGWGVEIKGRLEVGGYNGHSGEGGPDLC